MHGLFLPQLSCYPLPPLFEWPREFYQLLKLAVFILAGVITLYEHTASKNISIISGTIAIVFNPFMPIHLERWIWILLDYSTAACGILFLKKKGQPIERLVKILGLLFIIGIIFRAGSE